MVEVVGGPMNCYIFCSCIYIFDRGYRHISYKTSRGNDTVAIFRDLRCAFEHTLGAASIEPGVPHELPATLTDAVMLQAWGSFDGKVAIQSEGQPTVACHKGCPSCCTLRVTALAPEVFTVAAYLRADAATSSCKACA